jgi:hypothetical protein
VLCYQIVVEAVFERCFVRVQKGVTKGLKGHLLQAKRALFASRLVVFINSKCEKLGQKVSSKVRG